MDKFPIVASLANADIEDVNSVWAGLGYYSRASRLLAGAKTVMRDFKGVLPRTAAELEKIDGMCASFAFELHAQRSRHFFTEDRTRQARSPVSRSQNEQPWLTGTLPESSPVRGLLASSDRSFSHSLVITFRPHGVSRSADRQGDHVVHLGPRGRPRSVSRLGNI